MITYGNQALIQKAWGRLEEALTESLKIRVAGAGNEFSGPVLFQSYRISFARRELHDK
jgi:hypothetical protein